MLISNLQQFIRLLAPPLAATGINATSQKSVTASLEALAGALEPFREMDSDQLSELLKIAQAYRETGELPDWVMGRQPKAAKTRTPKAPKAPKMSTDEAVARLRKFQEQITGLDPESVVEEVQAISALTGPQLKEVQKQFLGAAVGKTKAEQLAAIQRKLDNFQTSRDRADGMFTH
jgi:hypothetical protein